MKSVRLPLSKSIANRALLLAALTEGECVFYDFQSGELPDDVLLMRDGLGALNVDMVSTDGNLRVIGKTFFKPLKPIQVGLAGTVLRFLLPAVALHCHEPVRFCGNERLFRRPLMPLLEALCNIGATWLPETDGGVLVPPSKTPDFVELNIDGSLSSQFLSGAAMAMAGLRGGGTLRWTKPLASPSYLLLTKLLLERFGCKPRLGEGILDIPGGSLGLLSTRLPGDWGAAAVFFCAAAILGRQVEVFPLCLEDGQPDSAILSILQSAGSEWRFGGDSCFFCGNLKSGFDVDLFDCPDLAPILAATAALAPSPSVLRGLNTLHYKESDRFRGCVEVVKWLGGNVECLENTAIVNGLPDCSLKIFPGKVDQPQEPFDPADDHRMAFAAALGSLHNGGSVLNPDCVSKSFPGFWEAFHGLKSESVGSRG